MQLWLAGGSSRCQLSAWCPCTRPAPPRSPIGLFHSFVSHLYPLQPHLTPKTPNSPLPAHTLAGSFPSRRIPTPKVSFTALLGHKTLTKLHDGAMGCRLLLLALLATVTSVRGQTWYLNLPPVDFWSPDIDVTSTTRLPRVPPSPYGAANLICPQQNGLAYNVLGFPGTPYIQTPFSTVYKHPSKATPTTTVCRTNDPAPEHCMTAYELTIQSMQARPFDATVPSCAAFPPTNLLAYNGHIPGPLITAPV